MAAINRVKWAGSGLQLAAGDDEGYIYIYDVGEVCLINFYVLFRILNVINKGLICETPA